MAGLFMPPGDPAALEEAAGTLRGYAAQVAALSASTSSTTARIASTADWTGTSADGYASFTGSFAAGMEGMEQPLRNVPQAVAAYAAALRDAQAKVADYQSYAQQVNTMTGPFSPQQAAVIEAGVQSRADTAQSSLAVLDEAAREAEAGLKAIGKLLDDLFGQESTFHQWLETATRPWDSVGADEILEQVITRGEAAEKAFKKAGKAVTEAQKALEAVLSSDLKDVVGTVMKDMLAGKADVGDLRNAVENYKVAAQWATEAASKGGALDGPEETRLLRLLPYLKGLGAAMDVLGVVGGTYTLISPPEYDTGGTRVAARFAGAGLIAGSVMGLAGGSEAVASLTLGALTIPGVGEAVAAAAGLYLVGDWAYHNTHAIAHTFDSARHTAAHYADDVGSWLGL